MISEHEVTLKWRSLFKGGDVSSKTLRAAKKLLDQLPLESPLRVRLAVELEQIRELRQSP